MVLHGLFCIFHGNGLLFVLGFVILAYSTSQLIRNLRLLKSQYEGVNRFTQLTAVDTAMSIQNKAILAHRTKQYVNGSVLM